MATRYRIEVTLDEDDPSEVLDQFIAQYGDETVSVETLAAALAGTAPATDKVAIWLTLQALDLARYRIDHIWDGEEREHPADLEDALAIITNLDDAFLHVIFPDGTTTGWLRFVLGNEPYEVICDYTTNLDDVVSTLTEGWDQ